MNHEFSLETKRSDDGKKWQIWACHNSCYPWYTGDQKNEYRWLLAEDKDLDTIKCRMDYFRILFGFSKCP